MKRPTKPIAALAAGLILGAVAVLGLVFGVIAPGSTVSGHPGGRGLPGYTRTSIDTAGGLVNIDTFQIPPGPPARPALPNLAIISIHPPSPCRATTSGTTVVFTPRLPPAPPS